MTDTAWERLAAGVVNGDRRSLARAITLVENQPAAAEPMLRTLFPRTGRAHIIGITGPPGAGKSTLVDALVAHARLAGRKVGVMAIDPSSPFTGGAVLGDRVRMTGHASDPGVFVRSMATRGHLGGLSRATADAVLLLDAAGVDVILIETVGVGQDEVDIARTADASVVVLVPGAGDDVQALKAGIMEIADVFVVNKADREGADHLVQTIRTALMLGDAGAHADTPILKTVATTGEGVPALWQLLERRQAAGSASAARRRAREEARLHDLIALKCRDRLERLLSRADFGAMVDDLVARRANPYDLADRVVARLLDQADT